MRDPRFALLRAPARGVVPSNPRAVDDALAKARTLAEGPIDFHHLEVARSELGDRFHCWEPFHEGFIRHIRAVPERQSTWVGIFENRFIAARDDLPSKALLISEQSSFSAVRESWQEETNPFVVWERLPDVHLFLDELRDATQMLIQLDVARGLEALDSLPFPSIMRGLLGRTFIEDRDIIEEMIKSAPAVFDDHGAWVKNRNVSALLVTDLILQHANALAQEHKNVVWAGRVQIGHDSMKTAATEHALKELHEKEIPEWFVSAFEQLLQRPDGQRIAIGYIVHLSRQVLLGNGLLQDPNDPGSVDGVALNALTMVVGRSVGTLAQLRNAWGRAEQYAAKKDADDAKRRRV
ncbi:MAG TPA: hypothetical protein PK156_50880, partial [Polyangium sp.]|nr:hypothetical protein [Polyangium sp.]